MNFFYYCKQHKSALKGKCSEEDYVQQCQASNANIRWRATVNATKARDTNSNPRISHYVPTTSNSRAPRNKLIMLQYAAY